MLEKRFLQNATFLVLAIVVVIAIWHTFQKSNNESVDADFFANLVKTTEPLEGYVYPFTELAPNDYNQLMNLTFHFKWVDFVCLNDSSPILLLVLVHSAPGNFQRRQTIRQTWGRHRNEQVRLVFLLGAVRNIKLQRKLEAERRSFGDMAQGSFLDSYQNLTYKHVMTLKYAVYHCRQARYILKTDDDVFVHIPAVRSLLTADLPSRGCTNLLLCSVARNVRVFRSYRSKWHVSFTEYPERRYPTYCPGWHVLYSPDVLFRLYKAAQNHSYFWIDDVLVTGILAKENNITHIDSSLFVLDEDQMDDVKAMRNVSKPFLFGIVSHLAAT